jgi:hypothetical protein
MPQLAAIENAAMSHGRRVAWTLMPLARGGRLMPNGPAQFLRRLRQLLELVRNRVSVRKLKPDPIPDEYLDKILEIGRWAMSGANGQPREFVVVKDPKVKAELFRVYVKENVDFI